jgi:hypothetical protein
MHARHRDPAQSRLGSALASAVWLMKVTGAGGAILLLIAAAGFTLYALLVHSPWAWPLPVAIALGIALCLGVLGSIVSRLVVDERSLSRRFLTREAARALVAAGLSMSIFALVGERDGRFRGTGRDLLLLTAFVCLCAGGGRSLLRDVQRGIARVRARSALK